jgi:hypothetical protein
MVAMQAAMASRLWLYQGFESSLRRQIDGRGMIQIVVDHIKRYRF